MTRLQEARELGVRERVSGRAEHLSWWTEHRRGFPTGGPLEHRGPGKEDAAPSLCLPALLGHLSSPPALLCAPGHGWSDAPVLLGPERAGGRDPGTLTSVTTGGNSCTPESFCLSGEPDPVCWSQQRKIQRGPGKCEFQTVNFFLNLCFIYLFTYLF